MNQITEYKLITITYMEAIWSSTRLINKIENNSTWEGAFYQNEWVKINSSWVSFVFFTLCVLLRMHPNCFVCTVKQKLNTFYTILTFHFKYQILHARKLTSLSWWKPIQVWEGAFSFGNEWNSLKMSYFQSVSN